MNIENDELQGLIFLASKAMKSIQSEPDYQESEVLKKYSVLYEDFINTVNSNDVAEIELKFYRLSSLSRAFLEISSDWEKSCLEIMYEFEQFGKEVYK